MATTVEECLDALREAADRLGESPSKAQYEELGLRPASGTISRVLGGWNAAKEAAGLTTSTATGTRVQAKPRDIDVSTDDAWQELSVDQRWHYRNRESEITKKSDRRARLRGWMYDYKAEHCQCERCGEGDPACLDFHHVGEKELSISQMITNGYAKERILREVSRCDVLCANCHRKEHYEVPQLAGDGREGVRDVTDS